MDKTIKLTGLSNNSNKQSNSVYLAPSAIVSVCARKGIGSVVNLKTGFFVHVEESPEEVMELMSLSRGQQKVLQ